MTKYKKKGTNNHVYDQSVTEINMTIETLLSMVAVIMKQKVTHEKSNMMDREINFFLSNLYIVDTSLKIERTHLFG